MIVKMKEPRDKNKACAAALTDLTKAYDFLKHDLLNAKLLVFGFDYTHILIIGFKSQKLFLITVMVFSVFLKAHYYARYYLIQT